MKQKKKKREPSKAVKIISIEIFEPEYEEYKKLAYKESGVLPTTRARFLVRKDLERMKETEL